MTPTSRELNGLVLHGDDFDVDAIAAWYQDEENAYADLYAANPDYEYEYEPLNIYNGFRHLPSEASLSRVCGLGSAYGDELRPIAHRIERLTIVESSDSYRQAPALDVPTDWCKAAVSGDIELEDASVDLTTSLGVLHHIPNVTHVLAEIGRITKPGGLALIREPIVSMGDWSRPREGLTPRERGIPRDLLLSACREAGFDVIHESWCFFGPLGLMGRRLQMTRTTARSGSERTRSSADSSAGTTATTRRTASRRYDPPRSFSPCDDDEPVVWTRALRRSGTNDRVGFAFQLEATTQNRADEERT